MYPSTVGGEGSKSPPLRLVIRASVRDLALQEEFEITPLWIPVGKQQHGFILYAMHVT